MSYIVGNTKDRFSHNIQKTEQCTVHPVILGSSLGIQTVRLKKTDQTKSMHWSFCKFSVPLSY